MKAKSKVTQTLIILFLVLAALVVSALVAELTKDVEWLKWLTWGEGIGFDTVNLNLSIIRFSFSFSMQVNVLQILCIAAAFFINKKFF